MKKLLILALALLALAACSSDPVYHGLTQQEQETYAQQIRGEYPGRYTILYTDAQQLQRVAVDSITFSVSDLARHTVIFSDFPLSLLAHVVDDPELSQALSSVANMGLTGSYAFRRATDHGKLDWSFELNPVALSLTYGGQQHDIIVQFDNGYTLLELSKGRLDGGTPFEQGQQLQLQLSAIYADGLLLQQFGDVWQEGSPEMIAVFHFGL